MSRVFERGESSNLKRRQKTPTAYRALSNALEDLRMPFYLVRLTGLRYFATLSIDFRWQAEVRRMTSSAIFSPISKPLYVHLDFFLPSECIDFDVIIDKLNCGKFFFTHTANTLLRYFLYRTCFEFHKKGHKVIKNWITYYGSKLSYPLNIISFQTQLNDLDLKEILRLNS